MFNWLSRKKNNTVSRSAVSNLLDIVAGAVSNAGTMTWKDLFGTLNHEQAYTSDTSNALKLSAVKCGLDIYTGMIGSIPRRMYALESGTQAKTRVVATTDHPASRIFSHYFHPELSSDEGLLTIVYDILMDGNAYFIRENDTQGRTSRLYYVHPSRISRGNIFRATGEETLTIGRKASKGELLYRIDSGLSYRDIKDQPLLLSRDMMVHFKGKVLDNEYHRAHGFVANSVKALDLYRASEEFGWKFYSKGIATQMFLTTDNRLAPEVLKRIEANFTDDPNAPLEDIFRTRVLEQGLKPVHMGIPFQHLQFIETRAFSVEDVARGLNVPPALLHSYMGTQAGNADLSQAVALFVQTGIGPLLTRIASQFRTELLPLPSQMLFGFEFELLYLYRNVIDKFSSALRNLFEIGFIDRSYGAGLLGMHIDPNDESSSLRYVPVNLMTVQHSLHLEEGAQLANESLKVQTEGAQKTNDGMVSAEEYEASEEKAEKSAEESKAPSGGKMDKSPSQDNIDKRLRNAEEKVKAAFLNVVNGLKQYETRVLDQKKQSRPDDFDAAKTEFYGTKFQGMLMDQLAPWKDLITIGSTTLDNVVADWVSTQQSPEGIENEITCIES
jgi:HK97 family phage portal protein